MITDIPIIGHIYQAARRFYKRHLRAPYQRATLKVADFPPEIWLENTNHCNAECVMCPREKQTRPLGFMDMEHYTRLINEIAEHKDQVERVHMHNFGEPMLDKQLPKRIEIAKAAGIKHVYFVSNASILTPGMAEALVKSGLDEFKISFYGVSPETYNKTMVNLDFDKTLRNVMAFFETRKRLGARTPKVNIQFLPQETNEGMAHYEEWKALFAPLMDASIGDELSIVPLLNFGDGRAYHEVDTRKATSICSYPWRTMDVLQDGRVTLCCLDYNGQQIVGDTKTQTLSEIWNGPIYRKVRDDFAQLKYKDWDLCSRCDIPMK